MEKLGFLKYQGSFNLENEKSIKEEEYSLGLEVDRVTEMWRIRSDFGMRRSVSFFLEMKKVITVNEKELFSGSIVKSLSNHFSTGVWILSQ